MGTRQPLPLGLILAAVTVSLAALTGCAGDQDPGTAVSTSSGAVSGPTSPPTPSPTPSPRNPVDRIYEACDFTEPFKASAVKPYSPDGPAYAGSGPHPAMLLAEGAGDTGPHLPREWTPFGGDPQLVVCQYHDSSYAGRVIGTCFYAGGVPGRGGESDVESARYIYRVFEARTGKLVTTFTLRGTTSRDETCPESAYYPASVYFQRVRSKDLIAKLRSLVEGTR